MAYKSEHLISQLRGARKSAAMNQRKLSELTGLTQSHISQIESGKLEPGLLRLIDLARALDLEVMLVPKQLESAVRGLVRHAGGPHAPVDPARPEPQARPAYSLDDDNG